MVKELQSTGPGQAMTRDAEIRDKYRGECLKVRLVDPKCPPHSKRQLVASFMSGQMLVVSETWTKLRTANSLMSQIQDLERSSNSYQQLLDHSGSTLTNFNLSMFLKQHQLLFGTHKSCTHLPCFAGHSACETFLLLHLSAICHNLKTCLGIGDGFFGITFINFHWFALTQQERLDFAP